MEGRAQQHQPDYVLYFTVVILTAVGVITVFSASTVEALHKGLPANYFAVRQLVWAVAGVAVMSALMYVPYRFWYRAAVPAAFLSIPVLMLVLAVGQSEYGGRRWIGTGAIHVQPSELAIVAVVLYLAYFFTKKVTLLHNFRRGVLPAVIVVAVIFALIVAEPDMGTAMTLMLTAGVILFVSGARLRPLILLAGAAAPVVVGLALSASYRKGRLTAFLHPFSNHDDAAYQLLQGWTAIASGGWFGRGFDMSLAKTGYLPFPQTDFIFPVFVEEWGLVGGAALLVAFAMLIWRGLSVARHAPDRFSSLAATGITSLIGIKTLVNLGAVSGLLPVTGIPLPFISYGGTSLLVNLAAIGIVLNISRHTLDEEPESDSLAEVIDVETVRVRASGGQRRTSARPMQPRPAAGGAKVTTLRTRRIEQNPPPQTWRARQESAATRTSSRTSSAIQGQTERMISWRERNASLNSKPGDDPKKKPPRNRKGR